MSKRAFTLIELMGVVIILSLLVMIAVPIVDKYIKQLKSESVEVQEEALVLAAKNWASDNKESLPLDGKATCVSLQTLMELGYLDLDIEPNLSEFTTEDGTDLSLTDAIQINHRSDNGSNYYSYKLGCEKDGNDSEIIGPPINLRLNYVSATINSLTVRASAESASSTIVKYEFNIDDEKTGDGGVRWVGGTASSTYTFKNIGQGEHTIIFKVTNEQGLSSVSKKYTFKTLELSRIQFVIKDEPNDCDSPRVIRIIYPAESVDRYYSVKNEQKQEINMGYIDVVADFDGFAIAAEAIVENINVSSSYTVVFYKTDSNGNKIRCSS